ncbi:MAG: hypothetical protein M0R17_02945 [Candidatus Omnitrophica bacterium]|jgi:hypothetical protein|nr:hypothetical protein [Candidatus Omnitrophota bacterium]
MKQKIYRFLSSITEEQRFKFKFCGYKTAGDKPAVVTQDNVILINKTLFNKYTQLEQHCILLHEVGHILANTYSEYIAHVTAIKLAQLNKLHLESKLLEKTIVSWSKIKDKKYLQYKAAGKTYLCLNMKKNYIKC